MLTNQCIEIRNRKILSFTEGLWLFGIDAPGVQEIIEISEIVRFPHAPPEVKGIVHVRGSIVTLLQMAPLLPSFADAGHHPLTGIRLAFPHDHLGLAVGGEPEFRGIDDSTALSLVPPAPFSTLAKEVLDYQGDQIVMVDLEKLIKRLADRVAKIRTGKRFPWAP